MLSRDTLAFKTLLFTYKVAQKLAYSLLFIACWYLTYSFKF